MRKGLLAFLGVVALSHAAFADDTQNFQCKRYKSKCTGGQCFKFAEKMQQKYASAADKPLPVKHPERANYAISHTQASETLTVISEADAIQNTETVLPPHAYEAIAITGNRIRLENRNADLQAKERVEIYPGSGFYASYSFNTDGSFDKSIPLNTPYVAYFGWCTAAAATAQ